MNGNRAKFYRLVRIIQFQNHKTRIIFFFDVLQGANMAPRAMKSLQRRCHIALVNQKRFMRLRHRFAADDFDFRQRSSGALIKFFQRRERA